MSERQLAGRVALVTGSSRRIGREIVLALARVGANVAVHGRSNHDAVESVRREAEALGVKATVALCDVSEQESVRQMIEAVVAAHGRLDILVNNASVRRRRALSDVRSRNGARCSASRSMARSSVHRPRRRISYGVASGASSISAATVPSPARPTMRM